MSRERSVRAPTPRPTSASFRYEAAQSASPVSTARSKVKSRFETPPVLVMTTTITTCGCSRSTSTWRIVVVWIGGAETIASRSVTWLSVSLVTRIASSTSRRASVRARPGRAGSSSALRRAGRMRSTK